jgi:hypothetical protein
MEPIRKNRWSIWDKVLIVGFTVAAVSFVVVTGVLAKFVGSHPSKSSGCIINLRQLYGATRQWALDHKKKPEESVTMSDVMSYINTNNRIVCPLGGKYTVGPAVSNVPTCSIAGHALPL